MDFVPQEHRFNIIRHRGRLNEAFVKELNLSVFRRENIFVPEIGKLIPVSPDDDHFIWELPKNQVGPTYQCTCGSVAVIAGYSGYKDNASQQGLMFVCLSHANDGVHATGGSRWV